MVYSGLDGDSIRISYREFTDQNLAREAFFQELTYPIASNTIRFRELLMRVHAVTADGIEFSVIENAASN